MKTYTEEELQFVLDNHKKWLNDNNGLRANLSDANLSDANLYGADLCGADLRDANLCGADLRDANLLGLTGNLRHIKSLQTETYYITYTSKVIQIGCQRHTIEEWKKFDDKTIRKMDGKKALEWWNKWKPIIMQIIEMSPCKPTKEAEEMEAEQFYEEQCTEQDAISYMTNSIDELVSTFGYELVNNYLQTFKPKEQ